MKIAIGHSYMSMIGGANFFIQEVANRMVSRGHEVSIVAALLRRNMYDFDSRIQTISFSKLHSKDPRFWLSVPLLVKKMSRTLQSLSPDVVISNHFPSYAAMLDSGLPGVWMCHEPYPFFHNRSSLGNDAIIRILSLGVSTLYSKYDIKTARTAPVVASNSKYTRMQIQRTFGRNSQIIYPGFDDKLLNVNPIPKYGATILAGAPSSLMKGFEYTLETYLTLYAKDIAKQLRIVGNVNPLYQKMILRAKREYPNAQIEVLGPVSRNQLIEEYMKATVFLYPSLEEPFGIMPLEAAALGTPVVYFKSGGLLETMVNGVTGRGVRLHNSREFLNTVEEILRCNWSIDRTNDEFLNHMSKFTWQSTTNSLLKLCELACGNSNLP